MAAESHGKGTVLARKAAETQGKGSVLLVQCSERPVRVGVPGRGPPQPLVKENGSGLEKCNTGVGHKKATRNGRWTQETAVSLRPHLLVDGGLPVRGLMRRAKARQQQPINRDARRETQRLQVQGASAERVAFTFATHSRSMSLPYCATSWATAGMMRG